MNKKKRELLKLLSHKVVEMEEDDVLKVVEKYLQEGFDPIEGIEKGLSVGMQEAGRLYEEEEYFLPELILCGEAMNAGVDMFKPHIKSDKVNKLGKIIIGVIEGDTHDIGKNIVKVMLEACGFEVYDLGRDVSIELFIDKSIEVNADIIAMSTLMTTSMDNMKLLIDKLNEENLRNNFKIMIGGGPVSNDYANQIGADGYSDSASHAVELAKELMKYKCVNKLLLLQK